MYVSAVGLELSPLAIGATRAMRPVRWIVLCLMRTGIGIPRYGAAC